MNNFDLLCSMGAETDVLVHWIISRKPKGHLKVPPEVYAALIADDSKNLTLLHTMNPEVLHYCGCKITIADKMEFV